MRRFILISLGLHAALLGGLLLWFHGDMPTPESPDAQGAVELVLLEQQGKGATTAPLAPLSEPVATPQPEAAAQPPVPPPAPEATTSSPPVPPIPPPPVPPEQFAEEDELPLPPPPVPVPAPQDAPVPAPPTPADRLAKAVALPLPPPPVVQPSAPRPRVAAPPTQHAAQAPEINLGGTDSETNSIASGEHVIPASADTRFHNKQPVYPPEAARRAEQGAVTLVIHVSPNGLVDGADVLQSSGYVLLDRAARDAVLAWHFLPAIKDGSPIPFDMRLRVVFHLD